MTKSKKKILFFFYSILFVIGCLVFKDFGLGLEENFQRASGFYWLSYILDLINLDNLKKISDLKYNELYFINPNLPKVIDNPSYGIIFDVPIALLEIILNLDNNFENLYLKHFALFLIFFISAICFTTFLYIRFSNFKVCIFGLIVYFFSPKIFGSIFFDSKDLFFVSIFTITIFFFQKFEKSKNIKNLILFSIFSAFSVSSRIFGLIIPVSFILFLFFKIICNVEIRKNIKICYTYLISFVTFLFLHWPYIWQLDLNNIYRGSNHKIFFSGQFYDNSILPLSYIPKLILITTPLFIIILSLLGLFFILSRFYLRLISIKKKNTNRFLFDLWRGENESIDFYILLCLTQVVIAYVQFNPLIYSSWRHFLFLHFFISYFFSYALYYLSVKTNKPIKNLFFLILSLLNLGMIYKLYIYHPFQYNYFNSIVQKNKKFNFEVDTAHLSRIYAIKDILKDVENINSNKKIKVGIASWSPMQDAAFYFSINDLNKIIFTGTTSLRKADYIYTNYIYEINTHYSDKYKIPENFYLYKSVVKDDILIYSIFKKK